MVRKSKINSKLLIWAIPLGFLGIFYFYPLGKIFVVSMGRDGGGDALAALGASSTWEVVGFTVWQAVLSTVLTLAIGLPGAYLFARYEFRGKRLLKALTAVPFVMPTLVVAAAFNALLGPRGWVNLGLMSWLGLDSPPIEFVNSLGAILTAHVFYNTTIVLRLVGDFWSRLDPRLRQAGRVLGAGRWRSWWEVTLPLLMPSILAAALLVFIFDFTSFGVILVLGGPQYATLEVEIYYQTISLFDLPTAAVLSGLQLAATLGLTAVYSRLIRKVSRPISLRPQGFMPKRLGYFGRGLALLLAVFFILPLGALAGRSVMRLEPDRGERTVEQGVTLDFYRELSRNPQESMFYAAPSKAVLTSLAYAGVTVVLALGVGLPAAWGLVRDQDTNWGRFIDPVLMLPLGTSAVTLGLGFIVALNRPPLDLRTSVWLIPFAHTLVAFPFVVRSLVPALRSIRPRIRQAAAVLGASPVQVARQIDLPLVGRAVIVAGAFAFMISVGEFGATALVSRPEYPTVPVMIYRFLSQPGGMNYGQAMALSTILMMVTAAGMVVIEQLRIADVGEF